MTQEELWQLFPIILLSNNPEWKNFYKSEADLLKKHFNKNAARICHIGSTAVEGLLAKPVFDILLKIPDNADFAIDRHLAIECGYAVMAEKTVPEYQPETIDKFNMFFAQSGFAARKVQIVDATIVRVPTPRDSQEENEAIKAGNPPVKNWTDAKKCQKDTDARWTQNLGKNYFGYKDHIETDVQHKIIRDCKITDASVHDSNVFEDILDEKNTRRDVYAGSAYRSVEHEANLRVKKFRPHLQRKGCKGHQLTSWEKQGIVPDPVSVRG